MAPNTSPPRRSRSPSDVALMRSRTPVQNSGRMQGAGTAPPAQAHRALATASSSQVPLGGRSTARYVRSKDQPNDEDTVNCRECFQLELRTEMVNRNLAGMCLVCQAQQPTRQANVPRPAPPPTDHHHAAAWTTTLHNRYTALSQEYGAFRARTATPTYNDEQYWQGRRNRLDQEAMQLQNFKSSIGYRSPSPQRGPAGPAPGSTRPSSSSG